MLSKQQEAELTRQQTPKQPPHADDNEPVWSILPSYYMFTNTVSQDLTVPLELPTYDENTAPPSIASSATTDTPVTSAASTADADSPTSDRTDTASFILADENTNTWKETILDNIDRLKNLSGTDNATSNAVKISFHFTKEIGNINKMPVEIDPLFHEYKQGDFVYGYCLIHNESNVAIPFEMFYLLFEGTFTVRSNKYTDTHRVVKKCQFLQMFDFSGSWNEAHINRLITELAEPWTCQDKEDPLDGTRLAFFDKQLDAGKVYKRFFTFKIPSNLLDSECKEHNLCQHVVLPPTIGFDRMKHTPDQYVRDFAMFDTAMSYEVMASFIGRKSKYNVVQNLPDEDTKLVNSKGDEFIILKQNSEHIRIVQMNKKKTQRDWMMNYTSKKLIYDNLWNRTREKIDLGKLLVRAINDGNVESTMALSERIEHAENEFRKRTNRREIKYNYIANPVVPPPVEYYEIYAPLTKKSLTGSVKPLGTLRLKSPKKFYPILYIKPKRHRTEPVSVEQMSSWNVDVPLDLMFTFPGPIGDPTDAKKKLPQIKSIVTDLVVMTVSSKKLPIPVEFHHDFIFNKHGSDVKPSISDPDSFTENVVVPYQKMSTELYNLLVELGPENFKLERLLVDDIKSMCQLEEKRNNLIVKKAQVVGDAGTADALSSLKMNTAAPWLYDDATKSFSKKMTLKLDLKTLEMKDLSKSSSASGPAYDVFCLVPNFQSCYMTRGYYLRISIGLNNGEVVRIKVPVRIGKHEA